MPKPDRTNWLAWLADDEVVFIKRFVLASGSLKQLAADYGISYPTLRLRLNRLIRKIHALESEHIRSEFERVARAQHAAGKIDAATLQVLLDAHHAEMDPKNAQES